MPPKTKRSKKGSVNLTRARPHINRQVLRDNSSVVVDNECQNERNNEMEITHEPECETMEELLDLSREAEDTDDEDTNPSIDLNSSVKSDTQHQIETFCEEWVVQLSRDDRFALGGVLQYHLSQTVGKNETEAAELAGLMIGRSERIIQDWKAQFYENEGKIPGSKVNISGLVSSGIVNP